MRGLFCFKLLILILFIEQVTSIKTKRLNITEKFLEAKRVGQVLLWREQQSQRVS